MTQKEFCANNLLFVAVQIFSAGCGCFALLVFVLELVIAGSHHDEDPWSYRGAKGPHSWDSLKGSVCGGQRQSPIDIDTRSATALKYPRLNFKHYDLPPLYENITNNGHSAQMIISSKVRPTISGGGLPSEYKFVQLHFHWGANESAGSEHTVDGKEYPLEMHLVHINTKYDDTVAIKYPDGLAVIGLLYELSEKDNPNLALIIEALPGIVESDETKTLRKSFPLNFLLPEDMENFYRYEGSLTTPMCQESVVWTVLETTSFVSKRQLEQFRQLKQHSGDLLDMNYRPVQPLNGRIVRYRQWNATDDDDGGASSILAQNTTAIVISQTILVLLIMLYWRSFLGS